MTQRVTFTSLACLTGAIAVVILLFSVTALPLGAQDADDVSETKTGVVAVEEERLNVRTGPGTGFAIVAKLDPGAAVQVLDVSDDGVWYEVRLTASDVNGWVASEFIALGDTTKEAVADSVNLLPTPTATPGVIVVDATAGAPGGTETPDVTPTGTESESSTSRQGPSFGPLIFPTSYARASSQSASEIPATGVPTASDSSASSFDTGVEVEPTATTPASLTPESQAVTEVEATPTPRPTPSVPTAVTQPNRMNVRGGPGTNYGVVDSVPAGTELEILAMGPRDEWYQVRLDGQDGQAWVFAALVEALGPADGLPRVAEEDVPPAPEPAPAAQPVAVSAAVAAAPPPSGAGYFGYGIQAHMLGGQAGSAMTAISDMGFDWVKQQVEWRLFQPQPGAIGFGALGGIVSAAGSRNINVLFSVVNAPSWARESGFDSSVGGPPVDPQTYANFVGAMAGQFCGTSLKAIEIWNEQNLHYEWGNKPLNPVEYMDLLRPAYASIKAACPEMLVISGALTPAASNGTFAMDDFAYLEAMYQNGLASYSDGIGAHPSGYNVPASVRWEEACGVIQQTGNSFNGACDTPHHSWSFLSTMEGYRNIMNVYGDSNKRIWPTEFGWAAGGAFDPRYMYAEDNSFDEQAKWTVEAYQMMKNWGWVGPAFLWNLNFRVVADGTEKAQWGIVGNDYQPLPTYNALKAMPK